MPDKPLDPQVHLTDPRALRAYAHPTRMALVGLLRREGPCTATRAAEVIGESVASCSYHLRTLARYGLVEEADPGGPGREKPWRATAEYTDWPNYSDDPAVAQAAQALTAAVAENNFHRLTRALEVRHELPRKWQEAEFFSDATLYLTSRELTELEEAMAALVEKYRDRGTHAERRPAKARRVMVLRIGQVMPDPGPRPDPGPGPRPDPGPEQDR